MIGVHQDRATGVCWMPDSARVVSASFDGTVRVWRADVDWDHLQRQARARVFRSLTDEERHGHLLPDPATPGEVSVGREGQ